MLSIGGKSFSEEDTAVFAKFKERAGESSDTGLYIENLESWAELVLSYLKINFRFQAASIMIQKSLKIH